MPHMPYMVNTAMCCCHTHSPDPTLLLVTCAIAICFRSFWYQQNCNVLPLCSFPGQCSARAVHVVQTLNGSSRQNAEMANQRQKEKGTLPPSPQNTLVQAWLC